MVASIFREAVLRKVSSQILRVVVTAAIWSSLQSRVPIQSAGPSPLPRSVMWKFLVVISWVAAQPMGARVERPVRQDRIDRVSFINTLYRNPVCVKSIRND